MKIINGSNVDIKDRPVNGTNYTIPAGESISNVPKADAEELLKVYGFLSAGQDDTTEVEESKTEIEKELENQTEETPAQKRARLRKEKKEAKAAAEEESRSEENVE